MAGLDDSWWVTKDQLDANQLAAFALPKDQNILLLGPPGSGKTNLLLLRAEYLARSGQPNSHILVFNRILAEFIRQGIGRRKFPAENISTHIRFFTKLLHENGVRPDLPDGFAELRAELANHVQELIERENLEGSFQTLLLDEVQDYLPVELDIFQKLAEHISAAGDIKQRIYNADATLAELRKIAPETALEFHYRNGRNICRLADGIGRPKYKPIIDSSRYDEAARPSTVVRYDDMPRLEDQCTKVVELLAVQLRAYPGELLGVICPRNEALSTIRNLLDASPLSGKVQQQVYGEYSELDSDKPILLCGMSAAKGLEFRCLHILGADLLGNEPLPREKAYTAVTRAKTSITIFSDGTLNGPFEAALAAMNPRADATLDDILSDGDDT